MKALKIIFSILISLIVIGGLICLAAWITSWFNAYDFVNTLKLWFQWVPGVVAPIPA